MNILVVDDEAVIVEGILRHLRKMELDDLRAQGAYSGREALAAMDFFRPDLLITDIRMPDMDGLELIAKTRRAGLCDRFIILTAYEVFEYARLAVENQALRYLVKPIDWPTLEAPILELAQQRKAEVNADNVLRQYSQLFAVVEREHLSRALTQVTRIIKASDGIDVSLTQLAARTELSENYICILFKKELGVTFLQYVYALRVRRAMELLLTEPDKTIEDIARRVGYQSDRQFFRVFREWTGMSPHQFRVQNGSEARGASAPS
ncbi:MAG: helix-turn-helix domain-containing protein [Oscillospiraceae bacterium]|jgi:YesN/AraC family two-component response regulator|nr:helix-turn-helix domain-containing protein [Oscillospiraceae bacterium]